MSTTPKEKFALLVFVILLMLGSYWALYGQNAQTSTTASGALPCVKQVNAEGMEGCWPMWANAGPPGPQGPSGAPGPPGPPGASPTGYGFQCVDAKCGVDISAITSIATSQGWDDKFCASHAALTAYSCTTSVKIAAYTHNVLLFQPDVPCSLACSLDAGGGRKSIKKNDGQMTDVPITLGAHLVFYDAALQVWRLLL